MPRGGANDLRGIPMGREPGDGQPSAHGTMCSIEHVPNIVVAQRKLLQGEMNT
jgi:hypothetical protein